MFFFFFFLKQKVQSIYQTRGRGISSYVNDHFDKQAREKNGPGEGGGGI